MENEKSWCGKGRSCTLYLLRFFRGVLESLRTLEPCWTNIFHGAAAATGCSILGLHDHSSWGPATGDKKWRPSHEFCRFTHPRKMFRPTSLGSCRGGSSGYSPHRAVEALHGQKRTPHAPVSLISRFKNCKVNLKRETVENVRNPGVARADPAHCTG